MSDREVVLDRIRRALRDVPRSETPEDVPVAREYARAHVPDGTGGSGAAGDAGALADLLAENLADYRTRVHRTDADGLPPLLRRLLAERGSRTVLVPAGLPPWWLTAAVADGPGAPVRVHDRAGATAHELDAVDSVVTGCAVAVAETGTIVLDGGPGQGRRRVTLIPDHHICVVEVPGQVVASVPQALERLVPTRPLTWISGPSATSDIELNRVEGVHGPRTLEVVLLAE
ncbi:LUD domain-containing protein [Streptomyces sp. TRM 70361]|uniref:LutC/YkgG family protein n=1 Tax=Streptomyces sp. TRM 70361 TaxID=3116553 RepID=UPI002E7ADDC0|nr:LUD domain-containing protein [Streptomyces sp. TRM 70361]MEE1940734.1 LUD domain-containing protein [Streptomyces sp. TRM 70361]